MSAPASDPSQQQQQQQQRSGHAPAPSLAISAGQVAQLQQQQADLSDKLKTLKLEQQAQQQQQQQQALSPTAAAAAAAAAANSATGKKKELGAVRYAAERVIGNGSFGVVYQATVIETGETVAIKKVLQDPKFKNRELQIMGLMNHCDVIALKHCFYSKGEKPDEVYLNLVMAYIPETIHRTLRTYTKANKLLPIMYTKVYMYQIARSLSYIHSLGVCHRDIKPQNLLLNTASHHVLLCDFGSAKVLIPGEPNVSYICSRYYRAPELVFEATQYTTAIDAWSLGCVMAEMLLGNPLFPGESAVDQLIEIIKILGTPTREEIHAMNPNHTCLVFGTEVRMADGTQRAVEHLKVGMPLLSSTGGTTQITKLLVVPDLEEMVALEYTLRGQTRTYTATPFHLVTVRCPRSPAVHTSADGEQLAIEWFDSKTIQGGRVTFRLAASLDQSALPPTEDAVDAPILACDVSARAREFGLFWLRAQTQRGVIHPLYAGDLFDLEARRLEELVNQAAKGGDSSASLEYVRDVVANLGVPICWATSSNGAAAPPTEDAICDSVKSPADILGASSLAEFELAEVAAAFRLASSSSVVAASSTHAATTSVGQEDDKLHLDQQLLLVVDEARKIPAAQVQAQFAQMVQQDHRGLRGQFAYAPVSAAQQGVDVAYMLHNPLSGAFGSDVSGKKAYAFDQLEAAWTTIADVTERRVCAEDRVLLTHVSPIVAPVEESDCRDAAYASVCFQSLEALLSLPRAIVAFGGMARARWMEFAQTSASVKSYSVSTPAEEDRVPRMSLVVRGRAAVTVFFAPHPTCAWLHDQLVLAIADAHGLLAADDDHQVARRLSATVDSYAKLASVRSAPQGSYVTFAVDSADHRFVLADGAVTHNSFKFPQIKAHPWTKVFRNKAPANAIDLVSKWLRYEPKSRLDPFESLAHPFFDELREPGAKMPNQQPPPAKMFQFTDEELQRMDKLGLTKKLIPPHIEKLYNYNAKIAALRK